MAQSLYTRLEKSGEWWKYDKTKGCGLAQLIVEK